MRKYAISINDTWNRFLDEFPVAAIVSVDPHLYAERKRLVSELAKVDPTLRSVAFNDDSTEYVSMSVLGDEAEEALDAEDGGYVEIVTSIEEQEEQSGIGPMQQVMYPDGRTIFQAYIESTGDEIETLPWRMIDEKGHIIATRQP